MNTEAKLEQKCRKLAIDAGWLSYKFESEGGLPDRIFIKDGRIIFVEFKAPKTGRLSKLQQVQIKRMINAGAIVHVCDNVESFLRIIEL
ncbi:MAG: VRR-NUC domain-containing protein [candidate division Zixibacteria bacterium]|nr:VRR-NUC domain-containing protein [candidate division Zixibacteria bacterium]